ncbi:CG13868, partial [Drosophila busckii]
EQQLADAFCGLGLTGTNATSANNHAERSRAAPIRTPSTSSSEEEEDVDVDIDEQLWTPTDLTSVGDVSERYSDIAQLLVRQQKKQLPRPQTNWALGDGYDMGAYNQISGVWPMGHPLPLPDWQPSDESSKDTLIFENVWQYEEFNSIVETALQRMLEETHYNTVNLFMDFYRSFKRTRRSDLRSFFQFYDIPINRRHHMCVSLAFEIMARLVQMFPQLGQYLYVVSCEEQVMDCNEYVQVDEEYGLNSADAGVEKEHVMVAMRFAIGDRQGVMILDPGYHVGRAVTVMYDQSYPHTGWFNQSKEVHLQRDYCYVISQHSNKFVEWKEREIRGDEATFKTSLIYVAQEYLTAVDVTVRRNLAYNFRSLLSRDAKGRVYAGLYFPLVSNVQEAHLTLFYDGPNEQRVKTKLMFSAFKGKLPDYVSQHLVKLAPQLNMSLHDLTELCKSLCEVVSDQNFITQVLAINEDIGAMSIEN